MPIKKNVNPGVNIQLANPTRIVDVSSGFQPVWSRPQANTEDLDAIMTGLKSLDTSMYHAARLAQGQRAEEAQRQKAELAALEGAAAADGDADGAIWAERFKNNTLDDPLTQQQIDAGVEPNGQRTALFSMINAYTAMGQTPEEAIEAWLDLKIPTFGLDDPNLTPEERRVRMAERVAYRGKYLQPAFEAGLNWYHEHFVGEMVSTRGHFESEFLAMAPKRSQLLAGPTVDGEPLTTSGLDTVRLRPGRGIGGYANYLRGKNPHMARMTNEQVAQIVLDGAEIAALGHGDFERANLLLKMVEKSGMMGTERVALYNKIRAKQLDVAMAQTRSEIGGLMRSAIFIRPGDGDTAGVLQSWDTAVQTAGNNPAHVSTVSKAIKGWDAEQARQGVPLHERRLAIQNLMDAMVPNGEGGVRRILPENSPIWDELSAYQMQMYDMAVEERAQNEAFRENTKAAITNITIEFMRERDGWQGEGEWPGLQLQTQDDDGNTVDVPVTTVDELHDWIRHEYGIDGNIYVEESMRALTADRWQGISPVGEHQRRTFTAYEESLKYGVDFQSRDSRMRLMRLAREDFNEGRISATHYEQLKRMSEQQLAYGGAMDANDFKAGRDALVGSFMQQVGATPQFPDLGAANWILPKDAAPGAQSMQLKLERDYAKDYRTWLVANKERQFAKAADDVTQEQAQSIREQWEIDRDTYLFQLTQYYVALGAWEAQKYAAGTKSSYNAQNQPPGKPDKKTYIEAQGTTP